jgi:hypothetical protein
MKSYLSKLNLMIIILSIVLISSLDYKFEGKEEKAYCRKYRNKKIKT